MRNILTQAYYALIKYIKYNIFIFQYIDNVPLFLESFMISKESKVQPTNQHENMRV